MVDGRGKTAIILAVLLSAFGLAACGESSEEKAAKQVCSATSDISKEVNKLKTVPISSSFPAEVKTSTEAINKSIKQVKEAAPKLETPRREEVDAATRTFQTQLAALTVKLLSTAKSSNLESALKAAEPELRASLNQLSGAYNSALQALKC